MILIAGGTGLLGTQVMRLLTARGLRVRILTRNPARARHLANDRVEIVSGDVRERRAVERAVTGLQTVISAIHGFSGTGKDNPQTVERDGNRNLIRAAETGGVSHFILLSVHGATANHPIELFRMKDAAEQELKASELAWTIVRPTAYMETWGTFIGQPPLKSGKTRIFGRGTNPINFVAISDVARFVELVVIDPKLRGQVVEVGGPDNLTMEQFVRTFQAVTGRVGTIDRVPLPLMRLLVVLLRPINPMLARQVQAGVVMDTHDMTFDPTDTRHRYPAMSPTLWPRLSGRTFPLMSEIPFGPHDCRGELCSRRVMVCIVAGPIEVRTTLASLTASLGAV